ncbi:MAG TPA: hypothetical protein VGI39_39200 [Polyangiaceae bacterium]
MDGIPPALPSDTEDVVWALQTAEALWKRGERVDAVVWVRRAAQAAGEGDDASRAATLGKRAADLSDWIAGHTMQGQSVEPTQRHEDSSIEALDALLGDAASIREGSQTFTLSSSDVEIVSSKDFESGFGAPPVPSRAPGRPSGRGGVASGRPGVSRPHLPSDPEVMTVSANAPDLEIVEDDIAVPFPEEEPTPVVRNARSPIPASGPVPSAAEAHAGMLDPWAEERKSREPRQTLTSRRTEEDEVFTSAARAAKPPPSSSGRPEEVPLAPRAPKFPPPRRPAPPASPPPPPAREERDEEDPDADTTTYRQINPRSRPEREKPPTPPPLEPQRPPARPPMSRPATRPEMSGPMPSRNPPRPGPPLPSAATRAPKPPLPMRTPGPKPASNIDRAAHGADAPSDAPSRSLPPGLDLLELVDSVSPSEEPIPSTQASAFKTPPPVRANELAATPVPPARSTSPAALPSAAPTPPPGGLLTPVPKSSSGRAIPSSARPTAPPPDSFPPEALPSRPAPEEVEEITQVDSSIPPHHEPEPPPKPEPPPPTLDLEAVEALSDLPDDARDAFARAATIHTIAREEEVSRFALALVVEGTIDVSSTIVDAAALRLEKNAILRSRGTLVPGVALRLVCASDGAKVATWGDAAVTAAFRTCPWVEEDLRAVADRVQARVGMTMGPLGERFDLEMREHLTSKLVIRSLAPGEVLVAEGKPVPIAVVGVGDLVLTKKGQKAGKLGPGDFVFPSQILGHGAAPQTAAAGEGGAVVLYGDRAVSQELLMGFPPLLEVLATM